MCPGGRYDGDLRSYLAGCPDLSAHTRLLLLTQLLEGVTHLGRHRVAHRSATGHTGLPDHTSQSPRPAAVRGLIGRGNGAALAPWVVVADECSIFEQ